jgi:REP-associated tyrosine transposase
VGPLRELKPGMTKPRLQTPGLIRHVMSRGNGRMCIFLDDRDYREFIYLLGHVVEEFGIRCWNYCLMSNHYHATLQPTRPNLSVAIQRLNSGYAQWSNRRHRRVGHVFQGRFKDQIVDREAYLMTLSRYVVLNPVRAGLVKRPEDWPWSSYRATAGIIPTPSFLSAESTLGLFGKAEEAVLRARFVHCISHEADDAASIDRIRSNEWILGPKAFKDVVRESIESRATDLIDAPQPEREPIQTDQLGPRGV